MHLFQPQQYETRNQLQEKVWGKYKHMQVKYSLLNNEWVDHEIKEEIKKH